MATARSAIGRVRPGRGAVGGADRPPPVPGPHRLRDHAERAGAAHPAALDPAPRYSHAARLHRGAGAGARSPNAATPAPGRWPTSWRRWCRTCATAATPSPSLLDELFGREENSVQITPPHLPAVDVNALGTLTSKPTAPTKDDRKPGRIRRRQRAARRRRMVWAASAAAAAVLGLLGMLAGGLIGCGRRLGSRSGGDADAAGAPQPLITPGPGDQPRPVPRDTPRSSIQR